MAGPDGSGHAGISAISNNPRQNLKMVLTHFHVSSNKDGPLCTQGN